METFYYFEGNSIQINIVEFRKFLIDLGIKNLDMGNGTIQLVHVDNNIIKSINRFDIIQLVTEEIKRMSINHNGNDYRRNLESVFITGVNKWLSEGNLCLLPIINKEQITHDSKHKSYVFFKNTVVEVSQNSIRTTAFEDFTGYVLEEEIIDRNFRETGQSSWDNFEFDDFMMRISGNQFSRYSSLQSIFGYLLHRYKHPSKTKAVVFMEEQIGNDENGGTGKGLCVNAIGKIRKVLNLPGRQLDMNKSFVFQSVNSNTNIVHIDDINSNFDFRGLYTQITGDLTVSKKFMDDVILPFKKSPKFVISTNYVLRGRSDSDKRRRIEFELSKYFNNNHQPEDEYGRLFFDDWNAEDWLKFDNIMIYCLHKYLQFGLPDPPEVNREVRRLIQETHLDFVEFMDQIMKEYQRIGARFLREMYSEFVGDEFRNQRTFNKWVRIYCDINKIGFDMVGDGRCDFQFRR